MAQALGGMGVSVAILDIARDRAEARADSIRKIGGTAAAIGCNVLDISEVKQSYDAVCRLWRSPDILINGAGGNDARGSTSGEFYERGRMPAGEGQSFFDLEPAAFR